MHVVIYMFEFSVASKCAFRAVPYPSEARGVRRGESERREAAPIALGCSFLENHAWRGRLEAGPTGHAVGLRGRQSDQEVPDIDLRATEGTERRAELGKGEASGSTLTFLSLV
jgi:hypothetical protein